MAIFPNGVTGHMIDCLARKSLWDVGLDYLHGTGHGVGAFLNVHEGKEKSQFFLITQVLSECNLNFLRDAHRISGVYFLIKLYASLAIQKIIRILYFCEEKQMLLSSV